MSESTAPPAGIYVPAVIFFKPGADEELDMDATKTHVLRLARGGVTGILVQGIAHTTAFHSR
jgi:4-hydroxy-2-oxoglutarate aldolase